MKKSELLKLLEQLDDNASVDEVLSQTDFAKSVLKSGLTLNAFKEKLTEDKAFISFMDSEKDKHYQKALETWKANNLQPIIDDAVLKATGKKKTPLELKVEELERKNAEAEARANELERKGKINEKISEKR